MAEATHPLPLAKALTQRTSQLARGLDVGVAEILDLVTPVTAELLRWWFGNEACQARGANFHPGQQQAILNTIVAHEVLGTTGLADLYRKVAGQALLDNDRLVEVSQPKHAHPKYCLKMATGTGKTWVLQALLLWQLLNRTAAQDEGRDDPRFSRRFLVVAPGLIVYERLLDAFLGKERADGQRDFASSDVSRNAGLFLPPARREQALQFIRGNTCARNEIGLRTTGNGLIAITNWHLLAEDEDGDEPAENEDDDLLAPGIAPAADVVARRALPLAPGRAAGNALDTLDRRWARGNVLAFLAGLPDLMVFNDEAHHIHELKKAGEASEVEWQKSLTRIAAGKGRRFVQLDFSATPYNDLGTGRRRSKAWFPHIIVDFDLKTAMRAGLVKSLALDRRKEVTDALPLAFKAERDADGNASLADGQKVMLRAGLHKLRRLETEFARIDPSRKPKMLVVCEDTTITPLVAAFLQGEGLEQDDVLTVDSGRKAELGEREWAPLRQKLFDVDHHAQPRVIVSVLMLREGFDVNNICVIVPLRSSQAQILLEQTIGRGLRLMWREPEFADLKRENRERINRGEEPGSLIDILSIVEHPAFQSFYEDLMAEGLVGATGDDDDSSVTGDLVSAELRPDFATYDIPIPFILRELDEELRHSRIEVATLLPFSLMSRTALAELVGKGETFISQDLQSSTLFGDYRVAGEVMGISGYNELLSRLTRRIAQAQNLALPRGNRVAESMPHPYLQSGSVELAAAVDEYIRAFLFQEPFEPLADEGWRLLALAPVVDHVVKVFGLALAQAEERASYGDIEVRQRRLSEVPQIWVRGSSSLAVEKCIYDRLGYPTRSGGLERAFIEWAQADSHVQAFCRISENRHEFMRLRYLKDDGIQAHYHPDFLVRTKDAVYLAETKAQHQVDNPNVKRKLRAATAWCERINALPPGLRDDRQWHYALLGESLFHDWRAKGARLSELLAFSRVRPETRAEHQQALGF